MNKTLYNLVGCIPIIGGIIQSKTNFFAMKCSPFMSEFAKTSDHEVLNNWLKTHPDKILSPKMAKQIMENAHKKNRINSI